MKIKRTEFANTPSGAAWVDDPWFGGGVHPVADCVHEGEKPRFSPLLGPDGHHLEYEPAPPLGFDTRPRHLR